MDFLSAARVVRREYAEHIVYQRRQGDYGEVRAYMRPLSWRGTPRALTPSIDNPLVIHEVPTLVGGERAYMPTLSELFEQWEAVTANELYDEECARQPTARKTSTPGKRK